MKVIDRSKYQSPDGNINYWDRMQGFMAYGSTWYRDAQAQQEIMGQLARVLDNRFVLLRNIVLPGTDVPIPLILAGPTGIWVMLVNGMRGVYRAKSDAWLTMDGGRFKAAKPNLVNRVQLMVLALDAHLRKDNVPIPEIRAALLFTNPGMHVDSVHPAVRVVLSDAMDSFVAGLVQDTGAMRTDIVQQIVRSLVPQGVEEEREVRQKTTNDQDDDDIFAFQDASDSYGSGGGGSAGDSMNSFLERLSLSSGQWVALAVVFGILILLLLAFAFMIMFFL
jgi:hypothetical protein